VHESSNPGQTAMTIKCRNHGTRKQVPWSQIRSPDMWIATVESQELGGIQ